MASNEDDYPLTPSQSMPTANIKIVPLEKRRLVYEEILMDAACREVESCMIIYVVGAVEPVGWQGIWKGTPRITGLQVQFQFAVEVMNISRSSLEAEVQVLNVVSCDHIGAYERDVKLFLCQMKNKLITVPLWELQPIANHDSDSDVFKHTASALDDVRFFYTNIWRPWDEINDDCSPFVTKYLSNRMRLCSGHEDDLMNPSASHDCVYCETLSKAKDIYHQIQELQNIMSEIPEEDFVNEEDIVKCLNMQQELEKNQKLLHEYEDFSTNSILPEFIRDYSNTFHIVAENFTVEAVKRCIASMKPNDKLKFHNTLSSAIDSCINYDIIMLNTGVYQITGFVCPNMTLMIKGMGSSPSQTIIVVEKKDESLITMQFPESRLVLENLKLMPCQKTDEPLVNVNEGLFHVIKCKIMNVFRGIHVGKKGRLEIHSSHIGGSYGEGEYGLMLDHGSKSVLDECTFDGFQHIAVILEFAEADRDELKKSSCRVTESKIVDCHFWNDCKLVHIIKKNGFEGSDGKSCAYWETDALWKNILQVNNVFTMSRAKKLSLLALEISDENYNHETDTD